MFSLDSFTVLFISFLAAACIDKRQAWTKSGWSVYVNCLMSRHIAFYICNLYAYKKGTHFVLFVCYLFKSKPLDPSGPFGDRNTLLFLLFVGLLVTVSMQLFVVAATVRSAL